MNDPDTPIRDVEEIRDKFDEHALRINGLYSALEALSDENKSLARCINILAVMVCLLVWTIAIKGMF